MVHYDVADVMRELDAMTAVGQVLSSLDQPAARQRVIRWAAERYQIDLAAAPALGNVGAPLERDVHVGVSDVADTPAAADEVRGKEPLDAIVRRLAADFQRDALESHGA